MRRLPVLLTFVAFASSLHAVDSARKASLASLVAGRWRGVHTAKGFAFQQIIKVKKSGKGYSAKGLVWFGLTESQALAASRGRRPNFPPKQFACAFIQYYDVAFKDDVLAFSGTRIKRLFQILEDYRPFTFSGVLEPPGILTGRAVSSQATKGTFHLWREGALDKPPPLKLGKRVVHRLACLHAAKYHYTCYIPGGYDASKPTPVLMNFSPGGNGRPLSTKMADELGWIMVGLTESKNGPIQPSCENRDAVLFDLRRRVNVHPRRLYFSGFSGGARMAAWAGYSYPGRCAGIICIGAGFLQYPPPLHQAVFFIVGKGDFNHGEVTKRHAEALRQGRKSRLIVHPGGHSWGRPQDHEKALRWLDSLAGKKK